jgi:hypothetical protein
MAIIEDERTFSEMDAKSTPTGADYLQIADAADGGRVKKILISDLPVEAGVDSNAIHVDEAGEIGGITAKAAPTILDVGVIEDAAAAGVKKSIVLGAIMKALGWITGLTAKALPLAADLVVVEDSADVLTPKKSTLLQLFSASALISGLTAKATPVGADLVYINDSAAANVARKATISSLPIAQAQVASILLEPAADAGVTLLGTTSAVVVIVTAAPTVVIANGAGLYAGQEVQFFASAVAGGGSYTLVVQGGTLTINATGEAPRVKRNAANDAWVVIALGGATIV